MYNGRLAKWINASLWTGALTDTNYVIRLKLGDAETRDVPGSGRPAGVAGSGQIENSSIFCLLENLPAYSDPYLSKFSCVICLLDFTSLMLILCYENSTFGVIMSWSGRVGSQKMDPGRLTYSRLYS